MFFFMYIKFKVLEYADIASYISLIMVLILLYAIFGVKKDGMNKEVNIIEKKKETWKT